MLELTLKKAHELVDAAVALKGEGYVYEKTGGMCKYVHFDEGWSDGGAVSRVNETPGCIVGQALTLGGVEFEYFYSGDSNELGVATLMDVLERKKRVSTDNEALRFLEAVQISQDAGIPWGEAVAQARRGMAYYVSYSGERHWMTIEEYNAL